jgi:hypothetical protein
MSKRRKEVSMTVTVSVPHWMTAAQARREVRTLINHQCGYLIDGGAANNYADASVKAKTVAAARGA